jgi:hypothetical protein
MSAVAETRWVYSFEGMETQSTLENIATLFRHPPHDHSLDKDLDLCQGLQGIPANTQVLNKLKTFYGEIQNEVSL